MKKLYIDNITKFVLRFAEQYHFVRSKLEQEQLASSIYIKYKISSTYEEYQKTGKLLIQSKQGGAYCYMTPEEVCADEEILSQMHPLDVNILAKLQREAGHNIETNRIIKQWFCNDRNETIYLIYDPQNEEEREISESELLDATHITARLNAKDCMSIGFDLGIQHSKRIAEIAG